MNRRKPKGELPSEANSMLDWNRLPDALTYLQVAEVLGVSRETVRHMVERTYLKPVYIGGTTVRFSKSAVEELAEARQALRTHSHEPRPVFLRAQLAELMPSIPEREVAAWYAKIGPPLSSVDVCRLNDIEEFTLSDPDAEATPYTHVMRLKDGRGYLVLWCRECRRLSDIEDSVVVERDVRRGALLEKSRVIAGDLGRPQARFEDMPPHHPALG